MAPVRTTVPSTSIVAAGSSRRATVSMHETPCGDASSAIGQDVGERGHRHRHGGPRIRHGGRPRVFDCGGPLLAWAHAAHPHPQRARMNGIVAYGSYIPYYRLDARPSARRSAPPRARARGASPAMTRTRRRWPWRRRAPPCAERPASRPAAVYFATANPAYLDKTNATAIHAALDLEPGRRRLRHAGLRSLGHGRAPRRARRGPADAGSAVRRAHRAARRRR